MQDKAAAFNKISELVSRFREQLPSYKKADYNETLTRRDFIDPFFKALGWDMDNEKGYAEAYREVIHEDRLKIGGATKAPDYAFRLPGGKRLFFVEAKKPSVAVKDDILPAYQVRRYGWSAKLPISIVTDFEELSIYDCSIKPFQTDKASVARIMYLTYDEYLKNFDFLWDTFSKERVLQGSFDRFVAGTSNKKGTAAVDKDFLNSLDSWRTLLAVSISKLNKQLSEDELNFTVQQTIDRLIFLRIAEDRNIEPYGNLQFAVRQGDFYQNLYSIFKDADDKYNSGLFDLKRDVLSKDLQIDNKTLKTIVNQLYYPDSPYEFSVLSVEILGSAYEQFLGKQITINKSNKAVIEEKPEVRKAGGVYYTPQYIVDYIVENTVGTLLKGKTPAEASKLKIVDPACGSGSFLIGAYQYLLDWHKNFYSTQEISRKGTANSPLTPEGTLTTAEKKRILLNNIYGVDIDVNAVEVTKLSLLLKCLEGETEASIRNEMSLFNERVLPTLDQNIKSGNSLIDVDFYDAQLELGLEKKVKPFNWQRAFPQVFQQGGFDAVIGNPPYFRIDADRPESGYYRSKYATPEFKLDIYTLFLERFINFGFKKLGFIIPNTLLTNLTDKKLRKLILTKVNLSEIVNYRIRVFNEAVVHTMILILDAEINSPTVKVTEYSPSGSESLYIEKAKFLLNENYSLDFRLLGKNQPLIEKLKNKSVQLDSICEIKQSIKTGDDKKYIHSSSLQANFRKVIGGSEIGRYIVNSKGRYVDYGKHLACPRDVRIFDAQEKILLRETGKRITAAYDSTQFYLLSSLYSVLLREDQPYSLKYVLGILNSNIAQFYMNQMCFENSSGAFVKARIFHYQQLLICTIDFNNPVEIKAHNDIVSLVDQLLDLNRELEDTSLQSRREEVLGHIDYCEEKINRIVYELYSLTEDEIVIIEKRK